MLGRLDPLPQPKHLWGRLFAPFFGMQSAGPLIIHMEQVTIRNHTRSTSLGTQISVADTFLTRLVGLLGRRRLAPGTGLLIRPSSGVHTFGMRFPIDVIALDRKDRVHALWPNLRPWRLSGVSWRIASIIELPAGTIERSGVQRGDQMEILDN